MTRTGTGREPPASGGANTTVPFEAGSLRCAEYDGYLYIRTCHKMYADDDGFNHQANLTLAVRQSDMSITDSYYDMMNISYGYDGVGTGKDRLVYFHAMDKATGRGKQYKITTASGSATPVLAPAGLEGGCLLWNGKSGNAIDHTLYYLTYSEDGIPGTIQTAQAPLSDKV